jgi:hypothetical protein
MSYLQLIENAKDIYSNDRFLDITEHKWFGKYSYFLRYDDFNYVNIIEINFWEGTNNVNVVPLVIDNWVFNITKQLQEYFSLLGFNIKKWV